MQEIEKLEQAISSLEQQRTLLGDIAVDAAVAGLRAKLASLDPTFVERGASTVPVAAVERKLVTVMFADLSGFTKLSESADPEHVRTLINQCFSTLVPLVEKYGGTVDKYIGDEIMALFGAPVEHENDAERALRAALEMFSALSQFNERMKTALGMHFGINTGLVVAGGMGSEGRQQYSVLGDTVNLASRLADAAESGEILVGPTTHRMTDALMEFDKPVLMEVKGKRDPVPVYRLLRLRTEPGLGRRQATRSLIVGRDAELRRLMRLTELAIEGAGGLVSIVADAGLGKSRLLAEVRDRLSKDIQWIEARAQSHHEGWNHWLARNALCSMISVSPEASPVDIATSLKTAVADVASDLPKDAYDYLARLMELPTGVTEDGLLQFVKPEALRERMWRAYRDLVGTCCRRRPLALVWEDLHWGDPASLSLLRFLLPLTAELPLLIVVTFRPNEGACSEWVDAVEKEFPGRMQRLQLGPLTEDHCKDLLSNLLRTKNVSDQARQAILKRSEGNPFFIEELLQSIVDAERGGSGEQAGATPQLEVLKASDTLHGVIGARIDRLPAPEKHKLQAASVVGRIFQFPVLSHILGHHSDSAPVRSSLAELERRDFVFRVEALEYSFKHAITHEVAYNTLLLERRRALHRAVAETIESLFPTSTDLLASTLAYHYREAGDASHAVSLYLLAADRAQKVFCNQEALELLESGLEQARTLGTETVVDVQERLGDLLNFTGRHEEARNLFSATIDLALDGDRLRASRLLRKLSHTWLAQRYRMDEALVVLEAAEKKLQIDLYPDHENSLEEWLNIQLNRWWVLYWLNRIKSMEDLDLKIRELVVTRGTPLQRAQLYRCRVLMVYRRDRYWVTQEVIDWCRDGLAASEQAGDLLELTHIRFVYGFSYMWKGDLTFAREHLGEALNLAEKTGDVEREVLSLTYLAVVARKAGDIPEATRLTERAMERAARANMPVYVGAAHGNYAWLAWKSGEIEAASQFGALAVEKWANVFYPVKWLALWPLLAIAYQANRLEDALKYAQELLSATQCRLSERATRQLEAVLSAANQGSRSAIAATLDAAVSAAHSDGYL